MRTLLLASACIVLISGPALACRGGTEFPQLSKQLSQAQMSPERVTALMERIRQGETMHRQGHREGDAAKLLESLRTLDTLKVAIAPWAFDFVPPDAN